MDEQEELQQLEQELNSIVGVSSDPLLRMLLLYLYSNTHLQIYELASVKLIVSSMREMLDLAKVHRNAARGERKNYDPNFDSELL